MSLRAWRAFHDCRSAALLALLGLLSGFGPGMAHAAAAAEESPACKEVRLADVGWTDVTATTAVLSQLLQQLGYSAHTTLLSVPVTFAQMKAGNIDVFLGNWMPAQTRDRQPYLEDHSVEVVRENLSGAKYTLAVPAYTYGAGLKDFSDIAHFGPALHFRIYGIESGNDGNRLILAMIQHNEFGLANFRLIESSEQGMLAEVARALAAHAPIVFLAWDPHPMNMQFDLRYLSGGDATFGPNYGGATVQTLVRAHFLQQCPNVAQLLRNLSFTSRGESELMQAIIERHEAPDFAARAWLAAHPAELARWLSAVHPAKSAPAGAVAESPQPTLFGLRFERWMSAHKLPVGRSIAFAIEWFKQHGAGGFAAISAVIGGAIAAVYQLLSLVPPLLLVVLLTLLAWRTQRSLSLGIFVLLALLLIMNLGYWPQTLETVALVLVATLFATSIGVPLGIAAAHRPGLGAALRPVLDLMQTLPTFVYLIPTLVLFGLGVVPALISTVVFALPAPIRLTQLGIAAVPRELIEAGQAFGATAWQLLYKVELPSAAPMIYAGVTQCIMLSLSMVVIAALVGAGGLGVPVVRALNTVQIGTGFEAGLAIVLLAIILERITRVRPHGRG